MLNQPSNSSQYIQSKRTHDQSEQNNTHNIQIHTEGLLTATLAEKITQTSAKTLKIALGIACNNMQTELEEPRLSPREKSSWKFELGTTNLQTLINKSNAPSHNRKPDDPQSPNRLKFYK